MGLAFVGAVGGTIATGGVGGLVAGAIAGGAGGNYAGKKHVKKVKKRINGVEFEGADSKREMLDDQKISDKNNENSEFVQKTDKNCEI